MFRNTCRRNWCCCSAAWWLPAGVISATSCCIENDLRSLDTLQCYSSWWILVLVSSDAWGFFPPAIQRSILVFHLLPPHSVLFQSLIIQSSFFLCLELSSAALCHLLLIKLLLLLIAVFSLVCISFPLPLSILACTVLFLILVFAASSLFSCSGLLLSLVIEVFWEVPSHLFSMTPIPWSLLS